MDEINEILEGFKRPETIINVNARLSQRPERDESEIVGAVRASVIANIGGQAPELAGFDKITRLFAYWTIMCGYATGEKPWADEEELSIRSAESLVFDIPKLKDEARRFIR